MWDGSMGYCTLCIDWWRKKHRECACQIPHVLLIYCNRGPACCSPGVIHAGGRRCWETEGGGVTLSISMRFCTTVWLGEIRWGRTSHLVIKSEVAADENYGPPSLDISSGTPNVANSARMAAISPWAPACAVPWGALKISTHPESRSPATI